MGKFSEFEFGRSRLPGRAIICASVYSTGRKEAFRRVFDSWSTIRGRWIRYSFARLDSKEYVVLFGIYGAAMMLETVQLLREGGVESMFMTGSMYAKKLPVGAIVIPTEIEDRAGIVGIDNPSAVHATPDEKMLVAMREELANRKISYTEGRVSSVPAVLHGIQHVDEHIKHSTEIIGQEMEGSTFLHFTRKHGLKAAALFYVSDNDRHSIISGMKGVVEARRAALKATADVAAAVLRHF